MKKTLLIELGTVVAIAVLAADQAAKALVRQSLAVCPITVQHLSSCPHIELFRGVNLVRIENAGSVFGYAQGLSVWVIVAALGMLLVAIYSTQIRRPGALAALAIGLQLSGALGNLVDRLAFGRATDFIGIARLSIFNLADVALAVGMVLAVVTLLRQATAAGKPGTRVGSAAH